MWCVGVVVHSLRFVAFCFVFFVYFLALISFCHINAFVFFTNNKIKQITSNLQAEDRTDLNFSLSRTSLNLVSSITLNPNSKVTLFIHFRPGMCKK